MVCRLGILLVALSHYSVNKRSARPGMNFSDGNDQTFALRYVGWPREVNSVEIQLCVIRQ
jgi:hypothetical protein